MHHEIYCDGSIINKGSKNEIFFGLLSRYQGIEEKYGSYIGSYQNGNSVLSEYISLLNGILLATQYKNNEAVIYSDCLPVVENIHKKTNPHEKKTLKRANREIKYAISNNEINIKIRHVDRSKNYKADKICEEVKTNYRNQSYMKNLPKKKIEKIGKETYRVGNHEIDFTEKHCTCFNEKNWNYSQRNNKKCEHIFLIEKELGQCNLHPEPNEWMITKIN